MRKSFPHDICGMWPFLLTSTLVIEPISQRQRIIMLKEYNYFVLPITLIAQTNTVHTFKLD